MISAGFIAVIIYIVLSATLILIPKRGFETKLKKDMAISDSSWKRMDVKLAYYRTLVIFASLLTVVVMLVLKFTFLS